MEIFGFNIERRKKDSSPKTIGQKALSGLSYSFIQDGTSTNMPNSSRAYVRDGYKGNPNVYSVVQLITQQAAKAKYKLMDCSNDDAHEEIKSHPLLDLLHAPNPYQSKAEFTENSLGFKLLVGELFIEMVRVPVGKNAGKPLRLNVLPPQYVQIATNKYNEISYYLYDDGTSANRRIIKKEDMIYSIYWNADGTVRGMSPLIAARKLITHDNAAIEANGKLLENGGPQYLATFDQGGFSTETVAAAQSKWEEKYGGGENYGKTAFFGEKVTIQKIGSNIDELGVFEGRKMSLRDICNVYGASSQLLNDSDNKTYNNMQEARKALITHCALPQMQRLAEIYTKCLVPLYADLGPQVKLIVDDSPYAELKQDLTTQVDALEKAWWLTPNQKLKAMGFEEVDTPEANCWYIPANLMPQPTEDSIDDLTGLHSGNKPASVKPEPKPEEEEEETEDEPQA